MTACILPPPLESISWENFHLVIRARGNRDKSALCENTKRDPDSLKRNKEWPNLSGTASGVPAEPCTSKLQYPQCGEKSARWPSENNAMIVLLLQHLCLSEPFWAQQFSQCTCKVADMQFQINKFTYRIYLNSYLRNAKATDRVQTKNVTKYYSVSTEWAKWLDLFTNDPVHCQKSGPVPSDWYPRNVTGMLLLQEHPLKGHSTSLNIVII